jgi:integrase
MTLAELFNSQYIQHIRRTLKPKTVEEYVRLAEQHVLPILGGMRIEEIRLVDAERLLTEIPGSVQANRAIALLSAVLGFAVKRQLLTHNPCHGVTRNKEKGREFFYTPAQTRKILKAASESLDIRYKYIALELLTGCRPGELLDCGPDWRYRGVLKTPDGKTGARTIFLSPAATAILDSLGMFFENGRARYFPRGMSLKRAWESLCRKAGVPHARLYDLRHTFASAALAAGVSLPVIGQMLGHKKAQTTLRYAHLSPDVGLEAVAKATARMGA